ncbi:P-loop containing nucleoside triphosphate hydrolase protein [Teratosphaeria nubilosa]|uniref:P-loop containing nucleoside triphosphate hydrolase protein n=1 Tax=Teratosphaeria nubilosa TaxID=161662 RepID=A0A6G1L631_9PEZI|nr:P-loop containing nucleoside triphosphate hydrolase protein [Teratosphaeria nubilosa]
MNGNGDHIHPFFKKATGQHEKPEPVNQTDCEDYVALTTSDHDREKPKATKIRKSKAASDADIKGKKQKTLLETACPTSDASEVPKTPPKKVLRLNANGKFSSPIKKSKEDRQASPDAPKRRGRPRKTKEAPATKHLITVISYGPDPARWTDIGQRIDRIISGDERVELQTPRKKTSPKKLRTLKKSNKPTHPSFTGKAKEPPPKHESPRKATATTPGKLRRQIYGARLQEELAPEVPYAVGSALLKDRLMVKHSGAQEPAWPAKEQTHIRGLGDLEEQLVNAARVNELSYETRKRKTVRLPVPPEESVLRQVDLEPEADSSLRSDGFVEPHPSLRLPNKLLIPGDEIRHQIAQELHAQFHDDNQDELSAPVSSQLGCHPALRRLWTNLPSAMTAWDECKGDPRAWAQKYAPVTAADVLQAPREMVVLKEWLASLTVMSVGAFVRPLKTVLKSPPKSKKKRRRKPDDLDDFLVDSDEDLHSMDTLTDPEDVIATSSKAQRSVIQVAAEGVKLSNAVLLSGPAGCGKTAAAYAVAKELGFKVFEINSHERRSGKDVLDKVGDMTENHLVKHHGHAEDDNLSSNEDANKARLDEAFEQDLASGRQGKMNAFFRPKAVVKTTAAQTRPKPVVKAETVEAVQNVLKKAPKDQQQSLILLEEVDILFKDDKEFWATVLKLIISSKRPFIMTCNDEDLVPLQAMDLHAILRLEPPSAELAVDYMLLLAAIEGHLLRRDAVLELYRAKNSDLRSSITELDLWCQMGVGDPRGGLAWIYQRWPPGSDVDPHGRKLRVVSQNTYQEGMGLPLTRGMERNEDMLKAWLELGIEATDLVSWTPGISSAASYDREIANAEHSAILREYDRYVGSLSSIDVLSAVGMPDTAPLDMTQPEMPDKARNHYIDGMRLLQTDEKDDFSSLSAELAATAVYLLACSSSHLHLCKPPGPQDQSKLTRQAYTCFDAISVPTESILSTSTGITQSIFDGPISAIATDLAPYVRSIVQYDLSLEEYRERLNNLTIEGDSRKAKRARTTRAARSAMEGSQRQSTRRERWFSKGLDLEAVLRTGGEAWPRTRAVICSRLCSAPVARQFSAGRIRQIRRVVILSLQSE